MPVSPEARLLALLSRVTYKAESRFRLYTNYALDGSPTSDLTLYVTVKMPNLDGSSAMVEITSPIQFRSSELKSMSDEEVLNRIFHRIVDLETHEAKEWFKLDGAHVFDPHPETKQLETVNARHS